jgi:2-polyprenyl-3-methyl-5-hydroxy-6-metoxy-1,4-benzoquinol methylase
MPKHSSHLSRYLRRLKWLVYKLLHRRSIVADDLLGICLRLEFSDVSAPHIYSGYYEQEETSGSSKLHGEGLPGSVREPLAFELHGVGREAIAEGKNLAERNSKALRDFYEQGYLRATQIAHIPSDDDFMYAQVLQQIRPYLRCGLKVLDLGCNDGNLSLYMARAGCEVTGIDLARNAIELATRSAAHYGIQGARFVGLDFLAEWAEPAAFDFVLCSHVIEHVPQDDLFVKKIAYALRPKGDLVLLTPSVYSSLYRICKGLTGRFSHDEQVGHLRRYTREGLTDLVQGAGFQVRRLASLDGPLRDWSILCPPLRRFNRLWSRRYVRTVFNRWDSILALIAFPAALCVHAHRRADMT